MPDDCLIGQSPAVTFDPWTVRSGVPVSVRIARTDETAELVGEIGGKGVIPRQPGPRKDSAIRHRSPWFPLRFGRLLRGADCGNGRATGV